MSALFARMKSLTAALAASFLFLGATLPSARSQQAERDLAFRDVDVFDGSRMIRRTTVLVRRGRIRAVGRNVAIPPSAQVIDGRGKTLLPGLFDAHTHLGMMNGEQFLREALDFGVTTELEMWGGETSLALRKKMAAGGFSDMADLRTAGTGVTAPRGHPTQMGGPPSPTFAPGDDAQAFVDARIAEGADYIKIIYEHAHPTLTKQQLEAVVAAAHRRKKLAVIHVTTQGEARDAVGAGADGLVHIFSDSPPAPGFAEFAARHRVFVVPTLSIIETATGASDKPWWQDEPHVGPYITPSMRRVLDRKFPPGFRPELKLNHALAAVGALHRAGVPILAGTDAPGPGVAHGLGLHRELELLVRSGLMPIEALASATSRPARAFGLRDRGRIAKGLRADLLLVDGDPTVDITATRRIVGIWKLGIPHPRAALTRTAP
ncbi:MAG TPA: amidohydrolase family protein [Pyrinomonadaceae bacterium]|nr:amidohydrolase family protein [Pyrinomonadaceae bacterium]